jgi:hypothetical protein
MGWPGMGDGGWGRRRGGEEAGRGGRPVWCIRAVKGDTSWSRDGDRGRRRGRAETGHGGQSVWHIQVVEGTPSTEVPTSREALDGKKVRTDVRRGRSTMLKTLPPTCSCS